MPTVLMLVDGDGERPALVGDNEVLMPALGTSWRFVCHVDDRVQGLAVVECLRRGRAGSTSRRPAGVPQVCGLASGTHPA